MNLRIFRPATWGKSTLTKSVLAMSLMIVTSTGISACAQETEPAVIRTISVTGDGEVVASPDLATIQIGVSSKANSAQAALAANSAAMEKAIAALKKAGVAQKDLQTSNISLYPDYKYDRQAEEQKLEGYRASNNLTAKIRDLDKSGQVLEAAVASGANQVQGISFGFADVKPLVDAAREAAVQDAFAKASLYAKAANVDLGNVLSIGEPGIIVPQIRAQAARAELAADSSAVPVEAGKNQVRARINIIYAIK